MKKYLMMGIAALALASCSKDDITYINPDVQKYETAFIDRFGQPAPDHTWGFGAETRALTRSAYPNANQWASQGYNVPDPLLAGQKARVQYYFQMVQYPGGTKDYGQIDFFVQQVYDGHDDPMEGKSPEEYIAADQRTMIQSGDHMDHLTAGSDNEHIYNFNNGTCSTNPNVGDNGAPLDTDQHSDEIMLMLNTKTDKFGYANSDASFVRTDRYRQVAGSVIDQYIRDHKAAYDSWLAAHKPGVADAIVDDDWHRSFIGFDFDQLPDKEVFVNYTETRDAKGNVTSCSMDYATWTGPGYDRFYWDGDNMVETHTLNSDWSWSVKSGYEVMTWKGKRVPLISADANQYCGDRIEYTSDDDVMIEKEDETYGKHKCLDMTVIGPLIEQGYLPASGSNMKVWIKVGGCADGYYSDWIVSFLPASEPNIPDDPDDEEYDFRVMAEDLTITASGAKSDFDFNDVVFDVKYVSSTKALVKVRAAGGIYPIRIAGRDDKEIHALLGGGMTMTNTYPNNHYQYDAEAFEVDGNFGSSSADAQFKLGVKAITIEVNKGGGWTVLEAPTGKVASKIGVPVNVEWCDEFQDIDTKWGANAFEGWVSNEQAPFWKGI